MVGESNKEKVILVIEDERPLAEAINLRLEKNGFAVVTARTVQQGLNYIEELKNVDAIWLDHYLLGKEDGIDLVTKLKEHGSPWSKIPIFVVSNTSDPEKVQSYIHFGVNKYYVKAEHRLDEIINEIKLFLNNPTE